MKLGYLISAAMVTTACTADQKAVPSDQLQGFARSDAATVWAPCSIAAGDFNGDGTPDLAVASCTDDLSTMFGKVAVHLNNGDGTFSPAAVYETRAIPNGSRSLALGDFDGDGALDVAVTHFGSSQLTRDGGGHSVKLLLGNGDGSLQPSLDQESANPTTVVAADFDRDGKSDLAVASYVEGTVRVLLARSDGSFVAHEYATGVGPSSLAVADLDHDANPDLVVWNEGNNSVAVFGGDGTGQLALRAPLPSIGRIAIGDVDHDGTPDLIGEHAVLLGRGGRFELVGDSLPPTISDIAAGDFDGDGTLDVVMLGSGTLSLRLGNGDGTFEPRAASAAGQSLAVADFDGDGRLDVAMTNADATISVLLNTGVR